MGRWPKCEDVGIADVLTSVGTGAPITGTEGCLQRAKELYASSLGPIRGPGALTKIGPVYTGGYP